MKSEMVERVAIAQYWAYLLQGIKVWTSPEEVWADADDHTKAHYRHMARSAIEALMEPTSDMVDDACFGCDTARDLYVDAFRDQGAEPAHSDFTRRWRAALTAALSESGN